MQLSLGGAVVLVTTTVLVRENFLLTDVVRVSDVVVLYEAVDVAGENCTVGDLDDNKNKGVEIGKSVGQ